jgi:hypothetical protein
LVAKAVLITVYLLGIDKKEKAMAGAEPRRPAKGTIR